MCLLRLGVQCLEKDPCCLLPHSEGLILYLGPGFRSVKSSCDQDPKVTGPNRATEATGRTAPGAGLPERTSRGQGWTVSFRVSIP